MDDESNAGVETTIEEGSDLENEGVEAEGSLSSGDSKDDTDWKALYDKQVLENGNLKTALTQKRQLRKGSTQPVVEAAEEDDEDKPLTRKDLDQAIQEQVLPAVAENKVDVALERAVKDPEKRKLVRLYYDTRIRQTGTSDDAIRGDIEAALAIADAHKLRKTTAEIARIANKDKTPPLSGSDSDKAPASKNHKFSEAQVKELTETAKRINADPAKFIEQTWKHQQGSR